MPIAISTDVRPHDDLDSIILDAIRRNSVEIQDGDILVIAHKIVSKAEGRVVNLDSIRPSMKAVKMAKEHGKDARLMELILRESTQVLRAQRGIIVSETNHGLVCANAGVDQSNVQGNAAVLLPIDPDKSARRIRDAIKQKTKKEIAIIIADTFGRPFRNGQTNVAIGVSGINPIRSYIGSLDMYGRKLRVSEIAIADELASAAELVMGKSKGVPAALIRGYEFRSTRSSARLLQRSKTQDLFR